MLEKLLTLQESANLAHQNLEENTLPPVRVSPVPSTGKTLTLCIVHAGKMKIFKRLISVFEEQAMG